jgi:hypothetical protein
MAKDLSPPAKSDELLKSATRGKILHGDAAAFFAGFEPMPTYQSLRQKREEV